MEKGIVLIIRCRATSSDPSSSKYTITYLVKKAQTFDEAWLKVPKGLRERSEGVQMEQIDTIVE